MNIFSSAIFSKKRVASSISHTLISALLALGGVTAEGLNKQIELQRQKVDIYKDSIEKSTNKLQEAVKVRDSLKAKLEEETSKYKDEESFKRHFSNPNLEKVHDEVIDLLSEMPMRVEVHSVFSSYQLKVD